MRPFGVKGCVGDKSQEESGSQYSFVNVAHVMNIGTLHKGEKTGSEGGEIKGK